MDIAEKVPGVIVLEPSVVQTRIADIRTAVLELQPLLAAHAASVEAQRRVSAEQVVRLREIGYFDIVKPKAYGGEEFGFSTLITLNIELAKGCASTAWVAGLLAAHQWLVAGFSSQAQEDVWGSNPDALVCGSYAPVHKAERVGGGYRLSGRWSFSSGCENAEWALCAALLPAGDDGCTNGPAFLLVPASHYVIEDTWHVAGLAGTGSKTLVLENVFVPEYRTLSFAASTSGKTPGAELYIHNPDYSLPMLCTIPSCLASVAVGAAQGALDEYLARVSQRVTRGAVAGGLNRMAEFPTIQLRVAEAAASVDAASQILLSDLQAREETARAGLPVSIAQRIGSRRGQAFAVSLALRAAEALNASTGGQGLDLSHPVQRAWRDVNAVGRHISMNWDTVGTMYGQLALGLEPKGQY